MKFFLLGLILFFQQHLNAQEGWSSSCAATLPVVKEIMIHPCGTSGESEYTILKTGTKPFDLTALKITTSVLNGANIGSVAISRTDNNTAALEILNNAVGTCSYGHTFVDAQAKPFYGVVPPNAVLIIFNNKDNVDLWYLSAKDLQNLCGSQIFTAFGTTTSVNADKTIFPNFPTGGIGGCGATCLRQINYQFDWINNCTKIVYDISKLPHTGLNPLSSDGRGASIAQNGNSINYGAGIVNPYPTDCMPTQNLTDAPCSNFPTRINDIIVTGTSILSQIAIAAALTNYTTYKDPYVITWAGPSTIKDNTILAKNLKPGKYKVHIIEGRGCESDVNVIVLDPNGPNITLTGADTAVCPGTLVQVKASISGGNSPYKYGWTRKSDGMQVASSASIFSIIADITTDYLLTVTDANNATQTQDFTIKVNLKPNVKVTVLPDTIVCNEVVVTIIGSGAKSYAWSTQPSIAGSALSSSTGDTVKLYTIFLPALGYDIIATGTDANGCVNTGKQSLVVNPLPKVTINPIPDTICISGAPIQLTGDPNVGGTYFGTCGICVQGDYFYPQFASLDPMKPNTISHKVKDSFGCENAPSIVINVKDCTCLKPVTIFAGNDLKICENSIAILHGKYTNATSATWSTSGTGQFGNIHAPTTTYSPSFSDFTQGSVVIKFSADAPTLANCNIRADSFTLTLVKKSITNINQNICKGDSFRIKKLWYKQSGNYSDTLSNIDGCDSIVNVSLTLNRTDSTFFYFTTCIASEAGVKFQTLKNSNNCDSVIVTHTNFTPPTTATINKSICAGDSLFFQNKYLSVPDTYTFKTLNVNSCDSIVTLNLSFNAVNKILRTETTCNSNKAGTVKEVFKNVFGCDSTIITTTTLIPLDTFKITGTTCDTSTRGVFVQKYSNIAGCDSVVETTLTYARASQTNFDKSICQGDSVLFNNFWAKITNTYVLKTIAANGCDSIVIMNLMVNNPDNIEKKFTTCDINKVGISKQILKNRFGCDSTVISTTTLRASDTIKIFGTTCDANKVGTSKQILKNSFGCDSTITSITTLIASDTTKISESSCDSTKAGVFFKKYSNSAGCDSIVITTRNFLKSAQTNFDKTICKGDSILFNSVFLKIANTYSLKTITVNGCDSLVTLNLFVNKTDTLVKNFSICDPTKVGTTQQVFKNSFGCDSTIISNTHLIPLDTFKITGTTCDASKAGVVVKKYSNIAGCDSVVETRLIASLQSQTNFDKTICNGDSVLFNNVWVKTPNVYILKTIAASGCDSIVMMNLRVNKKDTTLINGVTCDSTQAGTIKKLFTNAGGCDSLVITTHTFIKSDSVFLKGTSCNAQDTGTLVKRISVGGDCNKIITTQISFIPIPSNRLSQTICTGDSVFFDKAWIKTANTYQKTFKTLKGCDSTLVLNLSVTNKIVTQMDTFTCDAAQVGTKTLHLKSKSGCDSTVIINTTLGASGSILKDSVSCNPRDTGVFVSVLPQPGGCNKTLTTNIKLGRIDFQSRNTSVCLGDSVQLGVQWYKIKGSYSKIFKNTQGCDSTITLNLTILQRDTLLIHKKSCNPLDTGSVQQNLKKQNGCDSTVITTTQLLPSTLHTDLAQLKPASCYNSGDGSVYLKNISGGTPTYQYKWQNGFTGDTMNNLKSGWYKIRVTDANKCVVNDSVFVAQPQPISISVAAQSPNCFGQTTGLIHLDTIAGGTSPYILFFDGKNISAKEATNRVSNVGTHALKINDAHNCSFDTTVTVKDAPKREISLGSHLKIHLGDSILIGSFLNFIPNTIKWSPPDGLSCDTCLPTFARPANTTTYSLIVTDSVGCLVSDKFTITVTKRKNIFIPTAFSPDGNGINDKFILYADNSVEKILRMQIFSRWGGLIFSKSDCLPNNESEGWNGTFNSAQVVPDIYIYFFEVLYKDGNIEIFSGDVSLVR